MKINLFCIFFLQFMHTAEASLDSLTGYQDYMRHVIVCVAPEVIKSGVATKLNQMCLQYASDHQLGQLTATCTSGIPEKLATKCGFRLHTKVCYRKYADSNQHRMDARLTEVYRQLAATHGYARIMVKDV